MILNCLLAMNYYCFQTKSGCYYAFDGRTGEIVQLSKQDFDNLQRGESALSGNSEFLMGLQASGILANLPLVKKGASKVLFQGKDYLLGDFISQRRRQLVLEVTESCNLRCDYCVFGDHYDGFRKHSNKSLSEKMAFAAVEEFLESSTFPNAIMFYGGEPLLEFDLIRNVVFYAEKIATNKGKSLHFGVSTNGTLLDNEKILFFAEHNFSVQISIDGPREIHDLYRRYAKTQDSVFETIIGNIDGILAKEPDGKRPVFGCMATMAPPMRWRERNDFFASIYEKIPIRFCNFLRSNNHLCSSTFCSKSSSWHRIDRSDENELWFMLDEFYKIFASDPILAQKNFPLIAIVVYNRLASIHYRNIRHPNNSLFFRYSCLPGYDKLFCNVDGLYYPCERTERKQCFCVGNASTGFDVEKTLNLLERFQQLGACESCHICQFCEICFSDIKTLDEINWDDNSHSEFCKRLRECSKKNIAEYVSLMESNRSGLDILLDRDYDAERQLFYVAEQSW